MEQKVSVNNTGIESAGLTSDYMEAIAEYIWNGFDARATHISIDYSSNELDYITSVSVSDDGNGIDLSSIDNTFGNFMDSVKRGNNIKSSSSIRGSKGKGRFSFTAFSGVATWQTTCIDPVTEKRLDYDITIRRNSKQKFDVDNRRVSRKKHTGTIVTFTELFGLTAWSFSSDSFKDYLARQFGWFLFLNKESNYRISINGDNIDYDRFIAENEIRSLPIRSGDVDYTFRVTFIRWNEKIGEKFYFYFLNARQKEVGKVLTTFNNNAIGFYHSIYVESAFFDAFSAGDKEETLPLFGTSRSSVAYKSLMSQLQKIVREKQKEFVKGVAASELITSYEANGIIPEFRKNKYDQARRTDLISLVKGLYCIEPRIFKGLNKEQQKINVGLFNMLLDTDERDSIIELIARIISLTTQEREDLLNILKKTTVARITRTVNMIESRFKVIQLLKALVFDAKKFTSEIRHLQGTIENNYWLFGEQYHLVSANESFAVLQARYLEFMEKSPPLRSANPEFNRRPDIFLCRTHTIPDATDHLHMMEENLMVELKRPSVTIGKEQLRQIEDYLEIIRTDEAFNSAKRSWKFFIVGNKVDDYIVSQYESQKEKGKKFLVKGVHNYEIYAFTWDDIFMLFDLRHKFLVDHLEFDREAVKKELAENGVEFYEKADPERLTAAIRKIS